MGPFEILTYDEVAAIGDAGIRPACLIENSTTTALANATNTSLNWGSVTDLVFDNAGLVTAYAPGLAAVSVTGLWAVTALVTFASNATGSRHVIPRIGGVDDYGVNQPAVSGIYTTNVQYSGELFLTQGTTVGIRALQDSGAALNAVCRKFHMHLIVASA